MNKKRIWIVILIGLSFQLLVGCDVLMDQEEAGLAATGTVEAIEVSVASEVSGTVAEVLVDEGMSVSAGQPLLRLENDVLEAELNQADAGYEAAVAGLEAAKAALHAAEANLEASRIGMNLAELQLKITTKAANLADRPSWTSSWNQDSPSEFNLPSWYFSKDEEISAIEKEIVAAEENLRVEEENLADTLQEISNADFTATEQRLVEAQAAFNVAEELIDRVIEQNGREAIDDYLQSLYDSAEAELEGAQAEYDSLLSTEKAEKVLEARARVDVAYERYLAAMAKGYDLQTGNDSLEIVSAQLAVLQAENIVSQADAGVIQAESGVVVAEKSLSQAETVLDSVNTQVEKLTIVSPVSGVVLARSFEVGELTQPGISLLVLGKLDELTITVYLPEDVYGQVNLGDSATVSVDSYPGEEYSAQVIRIADKAEYTPRNVQTEEDRRTTVFAIELSLVEGEDKLKPGMPADVMFSD